MQYVRNPMRKVTAQQQASGLQNYSVLCEIIIGSAGVSVPAHTGAVGRFSSSTAEWGVVGSGLPGLADDCELELETGALRAQGNARRPRSCLRPHNGLTGLWLK